MMDERQATDELMKNLVDDILYLNENEENLQEYIQRDISKRILNNAKKFKKLCQK